METNTKLRKIFLEKQLHIYDNNAKEPKIPKEINIQTSKHQSTETPN